MKSLAKRNFESSWIPSEVQKTIEIVDSSRPSEAVPSIVDQAIKLRTSYETLKIVWMQLGIINKEAAKAPKKAGLTVVMNKCFMTEYRRRF
jgi:predicted CoA-binding protein